MRNAHDELAAIAHGAAQRFPSTGLARDHGPVTRRVRRDRMARAGVTTLAGVGVAGVGTFGVLQLRGADAVAPLGSPSPHGTVSPTAVPTLSPAPDRTDVPSAEATPDEMVEVETSAIDVVPGDRSVVIIERLAEAYDVTPDEARAAVVAALPPEAQGDPEGWLAEGVWLSHMQTLDEVAADMVGRTIEDLELRLVSRDTWQQTLTIASIAQAEATTEEDMAGVVRVIKNRMAAGMPLQLDTTLRYAFMVDEPDAEERERWTTAEERELDSPYNTYVNDGLPPGPIGTPSTDALDAVLDPADEDWLYFVAVHADGGIEFAATYEEHLANVEALQERIQSD